MTENGIERLLGRLDAKVDLILKDLDDLESQHHNRLNNHGERLAVIEKQLAVASGGRIAIAKVVGVCLALGGLLVAFVKVVVDKVWPT